MKAILQAVLDRGLSRNKNMFHLNEGNPSVLLDRDSLRIKTCPSSNKQGLSEPNSITVTVCSIHLPFNLIPKAESHRIRNISSLTKRPLSAEQNYRLLLFYSSSVKESSIVSATQSALQSVSVQFIFHQRRAQMTATKHYHSTQHVFPLTPISLYYWYSVI